MSRPEPQPYPACMPWWLFGGHPKVTSESPYLAKIQKCGSRGVPVASPRHLCRAGSRD